MKQRAAERALQRAAAAATAAANAGAAAEASSRDGKEIDGKTEEGNGAMATVKVDEMEVSFILLV